MSTRGSPPERVEDQRGVHAHGVSVSRRQTHVPPFHLVARYPIMHHSQAGVKRGPPLKEEEREYVDTLILVDLNSAHTVTHTHTHLCV